MNHCQLAVLSVTQNSMRLHESAARDTGMLSLGRHKHMVPVVWNRCQRWGPQAPPELTFTYNLVRAGSDIKLYYLGHEQQLKKMVDESGLASYPGAVYRYKALLS